jgi:hypothetical protein
MLKGWHSKPTLRSVKERLRSNVLREFDNDEVLLSAWIVTLFKTMAVMARRTFKTQLTMYHE